MLVSDTAWERIHVTQDQKRGIWGTENGMMLLKDSLSCLRKQLPSKWEAPHEIFKKNEQLFSDLDIFFVKVCITSQGYVTILIYTDI